MCAFVPTHVLRYCGAQQVYLEEYLGDREFIQAYRCQRQSLEEKLPYPEQLKRLSSALSNDTGTAEYVYNLVNRVIVAEDNM